MRLRKRESKYRDRTPLKAFTLDRAVWVPLPPKAPGDSRVSEAVCGADYNCELASVLQGRAFVSSTGSGSLLGPTVLKSKSLCLGGNSQSTSLLLSDNTSKLADRSKSVSSCRPSQYSTPQGNTNSSS